MTIQYILSSALEKELVIAIHNMDQAIEEKENVYQRLSNAFIATNEVLLALLKGEIDGLKYAEQILRNTLEKYLSPRN